LEWDTGKLWPYSQILDQPEENLPGTNALAFWQQQQWGRRKKVL
jgi:hypothetical protein